MRFIDSPIGKKIIMAVTGLILIMFLFIHLLGNSSIFLGQNGINLYAQSLHSLPPLVWSFRLVMLAVFLIHIYFGIRLTLENKEAKPIGYAVNKSLVTTTAAKTMIWTGLIILSFVIYHLLHFTLQITAPHFLTSQNLDYMGRPDVFKMIVLSFQKISISLVYALALIALMLHLSHGIQSLFQTLGLNTYSLMPKIKIFGTALALILLIGYLSIPASIITGIIKF
ncbi:MAG: succinate dehydrogenase cytochrome b subunit [Thermodesulfovibrionales bacterium]|nr:succinate dehydrogenase cytochrome b subunit [Thermodesulfovibrionales bacterium]